MAAAASFSNHALGWLSDANSDDGHEGLARA